MINIIFWLVLLLRNVTIEDNLHVEFYFLALHIEIVDFTLHSYSSLYSAVSIILQ